MRKPSFVLLFALAAGACARTSESELPPQKTATARASASETVRNYYVVLEGPAAVEVLPHDIDPRSPKATRLARVRIAEIEAAQAKLRPSLEGLGAEFVASFSRLSNAIHVLATPSDVKRIEHLPGVARVERVPMFRPALASALPVIGAPTVWANSTPYQGDGITIGIIDSGVDYTHADFGGPGTPEAYTANDSKIIEPGSFPTTKVVGGWDFVGDDYDPSSNKNLEEPDPDPLDCLKPESMQISGGHGTHVSGIATGLGVGADGKTFTGAYEQTFTPSAFKIAPGVAPRAKLYMLKIFGCDGSTTALGQALERAADPNQDGSFDDRFDVINASLGTSYGLENPTTITMIDNLTKVGTLFVSAAGNDGQNFYDVASPSVVPSALSVAASSDNQFVVVSVTAPASVAGDYVAAEAGSTKHLAEVGTITSELVLGQPVDGCSSFSNAAAITGKVLVIDRGTCYSSAKFKNAIAAGALAVILVDDQDEVLPFSVGGGDPGSIAIPGLMIRKADGDPIKTALGQGAVSVLIDPQKPYVGPGTELMAGFSGRGPSALDDRLKPELAAPGFGIDSARVGSGNLSRRSSGTSMASPMVAGAAALVRQAQPKLTPMQVKAALINSTEQIKSLSEVPYAVSLIGSGRVAVDRSVGLMVTAAADPSLGDVGVSFGSLVSAEPTSVKKSFVVENHGTADATLALAVQPTHALSGVSVTVNPTSITVAAGQTTSVEIELAFDPTALGAPGPDPTTPATQQGQARQYMNEASGLVRLTSTSPAYDLALPYLGSVRAAGHRKAKPMTAACASADKPLSVEIEGDTAHPKPVITAFKLAALDDERPESETNPKQAVVDLRAVGVATNLSTAESFDKATLYFGVAIQGEWTTPARGPTSVITVEVDSDQNGAADYQIRTEALSKDGPYGDLLVATTYDLSTGETKSRRFLNMVGADLASTAPFHNSVVVLPAYLAEIGLTEDHTIFDFSVVSTSPSYYEALGERSIWTTFDAKNPGIDPAKPGADGRPLYVGKTPVLVDVSPQAMDSGDPLKLLLLHHTNVAGERWEVVDLPVKKDGNLALTAKSPATIAATDSASIVLSASNTGKTAADQVHLSGTLTGGTLVEAKPSQGTCKTGLVDCDLGSLAAGASSTVTVTVKPTDKSTKVEISSTLDSKIECESVLSDNTSEALVDVTGSTTPGKKGSEDVSAHGGCGCRTGGSSNPSGALGLFMLALAAGLARARARR